MVYYMAITMYATTDPSGVMMWCSVFIDMDLLPAKPRLDSDVL